MLKKISKKIKSKIQNNVFDLLFKYIFVSQVKLQISPKNSRRLQLSFKKLKLAKIIKNLNI